MRTHLALVLLLTAGTPVSGDEEAPPAWAQAVAVLDGLHKVLSEKVPNDLAWIDNGLQPYRDGRAAIGKGDKAVRPVSLGDVRKRVAAAEVVLVADLHEYEPIREAFGRIVKDFTPKDALAEGRVAMALEPIALEFEGRLGEARASQAPRRDVAPYFRGWSYPTEAFVRLVFDEALRRVPVLACGKAIRWPDGWDEWKYGGRGFERNATTAARIARWLKATKAPRKVYCLYGAAHLLDGESPGSGIKSELEKRGFRVVVIVPFVVEWELALRKRFEDAADKTWYEVLPGVLRAPYVSSATIVKTWGERPASPKAKPAGVR